MRSDQNCANVAAHSQETIFEGGRALNRMCDPAMMPARLQNCFSSGSRNKISVLIIRIENREEAQG